MRTKPSTVKGRFYKAYELLFNRPYNRDLFKRVKKTVHKETLWTVCNNCSKKGKPACDPFTCPKWLVKANRYINQDEIKRDSREIFFSNLSEKRKRVMGLEEYIDKEKTND